MKRHRHDTQEWGDEVVRRYFRRREKLQQREKAIADLKVAWNNGLERWVGPIARWLSRRLA